MDIPTLTVSAGAHCAAVVLCVPVEDRAVAIFDNWTAQSRHIPMDYMERYREIRNNPALLLDGQARSMIITLFAYHDSTNQPATPRAPRIADYALTATDYHYALRARLQPVADAITAEYGGTARICVDSAPLRERYWAARAGLGAIGRNNHLYVPGYGARFHIAAILTSAVLPGATVPPPLFGPHLPSPCPADCRRCIDACPAHALQDDGSCDTSRCISCLTIEACRIQPALHPEISRAGYIFGCDICRRVCPLSCQGRPLPVIPELRPDPRIAALTDGDWANMGSSAFRRLFAASPLNRAGLRGMRANLEPAKTDNKR